MADDKLIYFDATTGLHRATKEEIKSSLKQAVTEAYGDVLLDDNYPDGIVINALATRFDEAFSIIETNYNMLDINSAEGVILDTLGNIRNEHRKEATKSVLYATIFINYTAETTVTYTANSLAVKDENNLYWNLSQDVTVEVTESGGQYTGTATGVFLCNTSGYIEKPSELAIGLYPESSPVSQDNVTITPTNPYIYGNNVETDIEFRNRLNTYSVYNSVNILDSLIDRLLNLSYVMDVKAYYNNTTENITTKNNLALPPTKLYTMINVDTMTDDKKNEIFNIIADYKGLGTVCWLPNPTTGQGTGYVSGDKVSSFLVPDKLNISNITIRYVKGSTFNGDSVDAVKTLIDMYIQTIKIGVDLTVGDIITYLYSNTTDIIVVSAKIDNSEKITNNDKILDINLEDITLEEVV